jgi:probable selenium-dependent hydroxylase accessory protein YqeC
LGLLESLRLRRGDVVAVAGAGGKTTLLYGLAAEAAAAGWRALVTTTTHMGAPPTGAGPVLVEAESGPAPDLDAALRENRVVTLLGRRLRDDKIRGLPPARVDQLAGRADLLLVEADGARGRSLKLPEPHEPVIPDAATLVVVVAGLDALGRPLAEESVHRLELVRAATGLALGAPLDEDAFAAALLSPQGYLSRLPRQARGALLLNKAEDDQTLAAARRLAPRLAPPWGSVLAGSARARRAELLA